MTAAALPMRRSKSTRDLAATAPVKGILRSKSSTDLQISFTDTNPQDWSVGHVGKWLDSLELPEYVETFSSNEIEGKHYKSDGKLASITKYYY